MAGFGNSITRYGSGCSATPYTCTTFSCRIRADDRASRMNRRRAEPEAAGLQARHVQQAGRAPDVAADDPLQAPQAGVNALGRKQA